MDELDADLRDLLLAWHGQELSPDRCQSLLDRLDGDPAFRAAFSAEIQLLGMIRAAQASEPRWLELEEEFGQPLSQLPSNDQFADALMEQLPAARPAWARRSLSIGIAALLLLAVALGITMHRLTPPAAPSIAGHNPSTAPTPAAIPLGTVARLQNVIWETAGLCEGDTITTGEYRLASGRAVLSLFNGATVALEGPARVELASMDRMICSNGKFRVHVPESAQGFTAISPAAAVVDLGTAFGLCVDAEGSSKVMVFEGKAEISSLNDDGSSLSSVQLQQNEAVAIQCASRRIDAIPANAQDYAAFPADPDAPLPLSAGYVQAVMESVPWGYWRFESPVDGRVVNEVAGRPALALHGNLHIQENPGGNHSIVFARPETEQYLLMDQTWAAPMGQGYAIEFWVLARNINSSSVIGLVSARPGAGPNAHAVLIELTARPRELLHKPAAVRFLHRQPPGAGGGTNVFSRLPYVPYRWYHIVAQRNGPQLELYVNGQRSGQAALDEVPPVGSAEACRLLVGRLATTDLKGPGLTRSFVGQLDEVAIYDRALTGEEIRRHFDAARLSGDARP